MSDKAEHSIFDPAEIPCREISDPAVLSKTPIVSVKMITYNHEPYIAQAIEGVVKQETEYPFELIIGEDCSTDGTREIVLDYQRKYPDIIRVVISDKNVGIKKNGRRTSKLCRGKYKAWCEGDDYWHHSKKLQKQVDYLEAHPEVGLVHSECDFHFVKSNKKVANFYEETGKCCKDENIAEKLIDMRYTIITCTVCVRKNIIEKFILDYPELFSEEWPFGDLQCWLGVALNSSVFFFQDSLATRRVLPESASHFTNIDKRIHFCEKTRDLRILCIEKFGMSSDAKNRVLISKSKSLLSLSFLAFRPQLARDARSVLLKLDMKLTLKQNLFYLGTQYKWANVILNLLWRLLISIFSKQ